MALLSCFKLSGYAMRSQIKQQISYGFYQVCGKNLRSSTRIVLMLRRQVRSVKEIPRGL